MDEDMRALVLRLARSLDADVVETHISWILLTRELAYKLKKPVCLPFVDYATPERRRHFCEEEVRLNRRLAPALYLGVSRITGPAQAPQIDGSGATLEHAVRMRRFPAGALFSERIAAGDLGTGPVDQFASRLARFHAEAVPAAADFDPAGFLPLERAQAALAGAQALLGDEDAAALRLWLDAAWAALRPAWLQRIAAGQVREGHGDLHLANVVALETGVAAFDCIEFDPRLRTLDIVDDAAFALMDFVARDRADLGWRFFNAWLEEVGAYEGIALLRFYLVSHALVRTQVEHLRQPFGPQARRYARAALAWPRAARPHLFITCGLPGSGKTFASQQLLERLGAVRVRSDVERKRAFGLQPLASTRGVDAYSAEATRRTYARLLELAAVALRAGFPVVLDAAFLRHEERARARTLAAELRLPFSILPCEAPLAVLRERVRTRTADASEADEAVLLQLHASAEPLHADEAALAAPAAAFLQ